MTRDFSRILLLTDFIANIGQRYSFPRFTSFTMKTEKVLQFSRRLVRMTTKSGKSEDGRDGMAHKLRIFDKLGFMQGIQSMSSQAILKTKLNSFEFPRTFSN